MPAKKPSKVKNPAPERVKVARAAVPGAKPAPPVVAVQELWGVPTTAMIEAGVQELNSGGLPYVVLNAMVAAPGALDHSRIAARDVEACVQAVPIRNGMAPAEIVAAWYSSVCGAA